MIVFILHPFSRWGWRQYVFSLSVHLCVRTWHRRSLVGLLSTSRCFRFLIACKKPSIMHAIAVFCWSLYEGLIFLYVHSHSVALWICLHFSLALLKFKFRSFTLKFVYQPVGVSGGAVGRFWTTWSSTWLLGIWDKVRCRRKLLLKWSVWPQIMDCFVLCSQCYFGSLTLLIFVPFSFISLSSVLWRCWLEGHPAYKKQSGGCWCCCLSGARCRLAYGPADATATHCLLLQ